MHEGGVEDGIMLSVMNIAVMLWHGIYQSINQSNFYFCVTCIHNQPE